MQCQLCPKSGRPVYLRMASPEAASAAERNASPGVGSCPSVTRGHCARGHQTDVAVSAAEVTDASSGADALALGDLRQSERSICGEDATRELAVCRRVQRQHEVREQHGRAIAGHSSRLNGRPDGGLHQRTLLEQRGKRALHHERTHGVAEQHERALVPRIVLHRRHDASKRIAEVVGGTDTFRDPVTIPERRLAAAWQMGKRAVKAALRIAVPGG